MSDRWAVGRRAVASVPVRVADVGGWTDTWFGSPGRVCSLAVGPGVEVVAEVVARVGGDAPVRLVAPALGLDAPCGPSASEGWDRPEPADHPLLAHAVADVLAVVPPRDDIGLIVTITSAVPPGASLGTSASVVVAVLAALDALVDADGASRDRVVIGAGGLGRTRFPRPTGIAMRAHHVETVRAGREAGVQDQWAAVLGGAPDLAVAPYPLVRARSISLSPAVTAALTDRLVTVVFGAHDSSAVHQEVITAITGCGGADHDRARTALRRLAALAGEAAAALEAGDVERWAGVLVAATEAQERLHPSLVGPAHRQAIDVVRSLGASGWKVNGAGGDGGSLTVLAGPEVGAVEALEAAVGDLDPTWTLLRLVPGHHPQVVVTSP